jgi:hypothetical protein
MKRRGGTPGKMLVCLLVCCLLVQAASCGYFMHPTRRGQTGGEIDWTVFVLDAIGLAFFVIPGVIAFAVDFATGTIYLPHTKRALEEFDTEKMLAVRVGPKRLDRETIERVVSKHIGEPVSLDSPDVMVYFMDDPAAMRRVAAR